MCKPKSFFQRFSRESLAVLLLLACLHTQVLACAICMPNPTESLADQILKSEHLVLAQRDPENPAKPLRVVRQWKLSSAAPPPFHVDLSSLSRGHMKENPDLRVLCGWSTKQRIWKEISLYEDPVAQVIDETLNQRMKWKWHPEERTLYYATFLNHEDDALRELAHNEVARVPYLDMLTYADRIDRKVLRKRIMDPGHRQWHRLYYQFLSQSELPEDQEFIRKSMASLAQGHEAYFIDAAATALIAVDGAAGVRQLQEWYLGETPRQPEELFKLHAALQLHGTVGSLEVREAVIEAYALLRERLPLLERNLDKDLKTWGREKIP